MSDLKMVNGIMGDDDDSFSQPIIANSTSDKDRQSVCYVVSKDLLKIVVPTSATCEQHSLRQVLSLESSSSDHVVLESNISSQCSSDDCIGYQLCAEFGEPNTKISHLGTYPCTRLRHSRSLFNLPSVFGCMSLSDRNAVEVCHWVCPTAEKKRLVLCEIPICPADSIKQPESSSCSSIVFTSPFYDTEFQRLYGGDARLSKYIRAVVDPSVALFHVSPSEGCKIGGPTYDCYFDSLPEERRRWQETWSLVSGGSSCSKTVPNCRLEHVYDVNHHEERLFLIRTEDLSEGDELVCLVPDDFIWQISYQCLCFRRVLYSLFLSSRATDNSNELLKWDVTPEYYVNNFISLIQTGGDWMRPCTDCNDTIQTSSQNAVIDDEVAYSFKGVLCRLGKFHIDPDHQEDQPADLTTKLKLRASRMLESFANDILNKNHKLSECTRLLASNREMLKWSHALLVTAIYNQTRDSSGMTSIHRPDTLLSVLWKLFKELVTVCIVRPTEPDTAPETEDVKSIVAEDDQLIAKLFKLPSDSSMADISENYRFAELFANLNLLLNYKQLRNTRKLHHHDTIMPLAYMSNGNHQVILNHMRQVLDDVLLKQDATEKPCHAVRDADLNLGTWENMISLNNSCDDDVDEDDDEINDEQEDRGGTEFDSICSQTVRLVNSQDEMLVDPNQVARSLRPWAKGIVWRNTKLCWEAELRDMKGVPVVHCFHPYLYNSSVEAAYIASVKTMQACMQRYTEYCAKKLPPIPNVKWDRISWQWTATLPSGISKSFRTDGHNIHSVWAQCVKWVIKRKGGDSLPRQVNEYSHGHRVRVNMKRSLLERDRNNSSESAPKIRKRERYSMQTSCQQIKRQNELTPLSSSPECEGSSSTILRERKSVETGMCERDSSSFEDEMSSSTDETGHCVGPSNPPSLMKDSLYTPRLRNNGNLRNSKCIEWSNETVSVSHTARHQIIRSTPNANVDRMSTTSGIAQTTACMQRIASELQPYPEGIIWARTTTRWFAVFKDCDGCESKNGSVVGRKKFKTFDPKKYNCNVTDAYMAAKEFLKTVEPWSGSSSAATYSTGKQGLKKRPLRRRGRPPLSSLRPPLLMEESTLVVTKERQTPPTPTIVAEPSAETSSISTFRSESGVSNNIVDENSDSINTGGGYDHSAIVSEISKTETDEFQIHDNQS